MGLGLGSFTGFGRYRTYAGKTPKPYAGEAVTPFGCLSAFVSAFAIHR